MKTKSYLFRVNSSIITMAAIKNLSVLWLLILATGFIALQFSCKDNGVEPVLPTDTTWTFLGLKGETINAMAIDPTNPNIIYVSGFRKLLKTRNGGISWDSIYQTGFSSLVIDPKNPETIYGGLAGIGKSTDGGHTWKSSSEGIVSDGLSTVDILVINPNNSNVLYAGSRSFYKSVDAGSSWTLLGERVGVSFVTSIAIDPANDSILYVGSSGIYKSIDAGENWTFLENVTSSFVLGLVVDFKQPKKIIAGCGSILKSENGGESWESYAEGIPDGSNVLRLTSRQSNGDLYAVALGSVGGGIYRRNYSDSQWKKIGIDSAKVDQLFGPFVSNELKVDNSERYLYFASSSGVFRLKL